MPNHHPRCLLLAASFITWTIRLDYNRTLLIAFIADTVLKCIYGTYLSMMNFGVVAKRIIHKAKMNHREAAVFAAKSEQMS
jgi:hypothetical protein